MRTRLAFIFALIASAATAEFLADHEGTWEGQGLTTGGTPFSYYVRLDANGGKWTSPGDGCEGTWDFQQVFPDHADGWENLTVGFDRCVPGLRIVLTPIDGYRFRANWSTMHGVPVADAVFMVVQ